MGTASFVAFYSSQATNSTGPYVEFLRTGILIALLTKWPSKELQWKRVKVSYNQHMEENSMAHTSSQALLTNTEYITAKKHALVQVD